MCAWHTSRLRRARATLLPTQCARRDAGLHAARCASRVRLGCLRHVCRILTPVKRFLCAALLAMACGDDSHPPMPDANPFAQWTAVASNDTTDGALTSVWSVGNEMFVSGGKGLVGMP